MKMRIKYIILALFLTTTSVESTELTRDHWGAMAFGTYHDSYGKAHIVYGLTKNASSEKEAQNSALTAMQRFKPH